MNQISGETRRKMRRAVFMEQCARAKAASEYVSKRVVIVAMGRGGASPESGLVWPTSIVVQGSQITDYTWEWQRTHGRRFRALRAYLAGQLIPLPLGLRRGY